MYIFLPEKKDGLRDLLEVFHSDHALFHGKLELDYRKLDELWIPKFKISYKLKAHDIMKEMGLTMPFKQMNKELSGILGSRCPYNKMLNVSQIIQNSFIQVDEKGTEATSGTWTDCAMFCLPPSPPPPATFVADHPFMSMIREDTSHAVFFVAVVLNPK
uniref:Serpin-ZX n=1 Tax=Tanacetum cinerariifolium TaxID=118510 RepID=A0A6L2K1I0_TANCI|nr:serpin-ZX [Tanacetum cinerariifolium]